MVVIGIIVLLVGILLVALAKVRQRAMRAETEARMNQFGNACTAFEAEHGRYPGVIPDGELAAHEAANGACPISCTENALLHLMGNYRLLSPSDDPAGPIADDYDAFYPTSSEEIQIEGTLGTWKLKVKAIPYDVDGDGTPDASKLAQLGEGPYINGKPYAPYFTPGPNDLAVAKGQAYEDDTPSLVIPDLVDAWGQPILFVKTSRERGPLVKDAATPTAGPQFSLAGVDSFLHRHIAFGNEQAEQLGVGEMGRFQCFDAGGNTRGSMLTVGTDTQKAKTFATILAHPAFYDPTRPLYGSPRGAFMLWSAGADGVYFSSADGPGSEGQPIDQGGPYNVDNVVANGPKVIDEFDDVRVFGG